MKEKYNHWTVLFVGMPDKKTGKRICHVVCDCGRVHKNDYYMVKTGRSKMCKACSAKITKNNTKHGLRNSRIYKIWCGIKYRCGRDKNYLNIKICDLWEKDFMSFYIWATEHGYGDNLTIERINSKGNYCPENCRWATSKEQTRNTSRSHYVLYKGRKITVGELAEMCGVNYDTVLTRLQRGWTPESATKKVIR